MGVCGSSEGGGQREKTVHRLLLLGAGEAGKSTIFKQIKIMKKDGFSDDDRLGYKKLFCKKILEWLKVILTEMGDAVDGVDADSVTALKGAELDDLDSMALAEGSADHTLLAALATVWGNEKVRDAFKDTCAVKDESVEYLFNGLDKICTAAYLPQDADILFFRSPTTDISEVDYEVNDWVSMRLIDIGGQRKERLKWNTVGEITAVIFVVAMDEYNKTLVEDTSRNRMKESLLLFRMITTKHFADKPIILFLNKKDLFLTKIQTVDLKCCFPEYTGGCDYAAAADYIEQEFRKVAGLERGASLTNKIYVHRTCATETDQMIKVLESVEHIIFELNIDDNLMN